MPSTTDLLNRALSLIGAARITSINAEDVRAQSIRDVYDESRVELLAQHPWNFASWRRALAPDVQRPEYRWDFRFRKPTADGVRGPWLRTIGVWRDADERAPAEYQDEGSYLLSDETILYIRYVADIEDPNKMMPGFRSALVYKLAAELAVTLANSNSLADRLRKEAKTRLDEARSVDAMDDMPQRLPSSAWEEAMLGGVQVTGET